MNISKPSEDLSLFNGYKIKIYPTEEQKQKILKAISLYRATYNLALELQIKAYKEENRHIQYYEMSEIFSNLRNNNPEYAWLKGIQIGTIRRAIVNLDRGFDKFFDKVNKFPKFKSRRKSKKCFHTRSERTNVYGNKIYIPELGLVEGKNHPIPTGARLHQTVVTYDGYDFWFSCNTAKTELVDMYDIPQSEPVGIDVGIRNMITTSDGDFYHLPNLSKLDKRLRRQQKKLSKDYSKYIDLSIHTRTKYEDVPKSNNFYKRLYKMHKTQSKITNSRLTAIHTATKRIVDKNPAAIVVEDISVRSMIRDNKSLKKRLPQMVFNLIHHQLEYKSKERGIKFMKADKYFPSTKKCSNCGCINDIGNKKIYTCRVCGFTIDRDLNAAYNLRDLAYQNF